MPGDRVSEVYHGLALSERSQQYLRQRIDWMVAQAVGPRVLDIGCSQGIASILLARQGMRVVGIDLDEDAIRYARDELAKESAEVQARTQFLVGDITQAELDRGPFDTALLGEVIEHTPEPAAFITRAHALLRGGGHAVITTPFGVLDHPDHFGTYYFSNFLSLVLPYFEMEALDVIGKRICFRGGKTTAPDSREDGGDRNYWKRLLKLAEHNFQRAEADYLEDHKKHLAHHAELNAELSQARYKLRRVEERRAELSSELSQTRKALVSARQELRSIKSSRSYRILQRVRTLVFVKYPLLGRLVRVLVRMS